VKIAKKKGVDRENGMPGRYVWDEQKNSVPNTIQDDSIGQEATHRWGKLVAREMEPKRAAFSLTIARSGKKMTGKHRQKKRETWGKKGPEGAKIFLS